MVSLPVLFWMFIVLFASIGSMRGWARELLVTFSAILAVFIITVLTTFVPFISNMRDSSPTTLLWLEIIIVASLAFFGYQTPNIQRLSAGNRFARDRLQDILLGIFLGALNGWLIIGSIWFYMNQADYPFSVITKPAGAVLTQTNQMMSMMPPNLLNAKTIYFAVALAFAFVLIVFI